MPEPAIHNRSGTGPKQEYLVSKDARASGLSVPFSAKFAPHTRTSAHGRRTLVIPCVSFKPALYPLFQKNEKFAVHASSLASGKNANTLQQCMRDIPYGQINHFDSVLIII